MPSANNQSVWTNEDENKSITLKGMDIDHNDNLTYHVVRIQQHGELDNLNRLNGFVTYIPIPNYAGADNFTFEVSDGLVNSNNVATVNITVNSINDAPIVVNSTTITDEDRFSKSDVKRR